MERKVVVLLQPLGPKSVKSFPSEHRTRRPAGRGSPPRVRPHIQVQRLDAKHDSAPPAFAPVLPG